MYNVRHACQALNTQTIAKASGRLIGCAQWPVATGVNLPAQGGALANGTYRLRNRASGRYLDNLGATADGANVAQWASSSSLNQRWVLTTSGGYSRLRAVTGGKYLDSVNRTADGSAVGQWADGPNFNQQWTLVAVDSYYKLVNRANGKAVDTGGQTADGAVMQFWYDNISFNQQWAFEFVSSSTSLTSATAALVESAAPLQVLVSPPAKEISVVLPKSAAGVARVTVVDETGLPWAEGMFTGESHRLSTENIPAGRYILRVSDDFGVLEERQILVRP